ncbi:phosphocholine-specific phospholipase C [Acinetobacter sp. YH16032]|uniref:phosphocholine-specific phospholipase C n=1 Tax=Acinetobacter sp. YH16032 TaxID=2601181 RepID=UPI0015D43406|nr:phospholipase C, phosphocholine-specific [Acinetobacter sp. YH16032]
MNRRDFIKNSGKAILGATAVATLPISIQKALAIDAKVTTGTIEDVKHIVILTQENRSFDHYFGSLKGVHGFQDRITIPLPNKRNIWQQIDENGKIIQPYHLDSTQGNAQRVKGTPHTWIDGQQAWDNGRLTNWPKFKETQSMGYYTRQELEFHYALADAFTICDAYHCAMHAGTNPNRHFIWNGHHGPTAAGVSNVVNEYNVIGFSNQGYDWKTYPERLQEAGVTWKVYQNLPDNFLCNPLAGFKQYRRESEQAFLKGVSSLSPYNSKDDNQFPLLKGISNTLPGVGGNIDALKKDIADGNLPSVSWIVCPAAYSEHPSLSSPVQGGWFIQEILNALTENEEVWSQTVFLINYDENDGYFDHVPSPCAPSKDKNGKIWGKSTLSDTEMAYEYYTHPPAPSTTGQPDPDGGVYGPGIRVPMLVISPWSRGGWVNSQIFDHTSIIRFIETRFGVFEPNISPYRRKLCGDLTSSFNFKNPNLEKLPKLAGTKSQNEVNAISLSQGAKPQIKVPTSYQPLRQEFGLRPSRALPYILHTSAIVENTYAQLIFANSGNQGGLFHVYDRLNLDVYPKRYFVEPGKQLEDSWQINAGEYDLFVLGPNGYHRSFVGNIRSDNLEPEIQVCYDLCHYYLTVKFKNITQPGVLYLKNNAYDSNKIIEISNKQLDEGIVLDVSKFSGWYDFSLMNHHNEKYERRFAGRMEIGKDSISEPHM